MRNGDGQRAVHKGKLLLPQFASVFSRRADPHLTDLCIKISTGRDPTKRDRQYGEQRMISAVTGLSPPSRLKKLTT